MKAEDEAEKPAVMARQKEAPGRALRPDPAAGPQGQDDARQADPGRPGRQAARGDDLGRSWPRCRPTRSASKGLFPKGFLPLPHPQPRGRAAWSSRRWRSSNWPGCERFDLDFDLPEHFLPEFPPAIFLTTPARPGRRLAGEAGDGGELPGDLPGHPERQGPGGHAAAGDAVPAAAVQRHGRPQDRAARRACRAWPASTATSTATPRRRRTWWATSGRSRTAAASTRRACAA